jgi:hypothetical protein
MKLLLNFIIGFSFLLILSIAMVSSSCKKDYITPSADCILPTDADGLQEIITISNSKLYKFGNLPDSSKSPISPKITIFQPSASASAGYQLILPLKFTSSTELEYIYLQIDGATNGYFKIDITESVRGFGTLTIPINLPLLACNGEFSVRFCLVDYNGYISSQKQTLIVIRDPLECSNADNSGTEGLTFSQVDLGSESGKVVLSYDTYSVPDRVDIFQGTKWLGGTGSNPGSVIPPLCNCSSVLPGFIGKRGKIDFMYDPSEGRVITIVVSGCLGGGTAWEWNLTCP